MLLGHNSDGIRMLLGHNSDGMKMLLGHNSDGMKMLLGHKTVKTVRGSFVTTFLLFRVVLTLGVLQIDGNVQGHVHLKLKYMDGYRSVDRINCSLVIPVNRQRQSDGY